MTAPAKPARRRHPNGVIARLVAFFEANPDEELTVNDIVEKFGSCRRTVENALYTARQDGEPLEIVRLVRRKRGGA